MLAAGMLADAPADVSGEHVRERARDGGRLTVERGEPAAACRPGLAQHQPGAAGHVADLVGAHVGPGEPVAGRALPAQPDPVTAQRDARSLDFDQRVTVGGQQVADPAQQRGRVTADADVPVGQQHRPPPARAGYPVEDVAVHGEGPGRLGQLDRVRRHVDAQRRDAALGQRHRQPARAGPHVQGRPVAPVDQRPIARRDLQPLPDGQRDAGAVGVFDLGLYGAGQRRLVKFAEHAVSSRGVHTPATWHVVPCRAVSPNAQLNHTRPLIRSDLRH